MKAFALYRTCITAAIFMLLTSTSFATVQVNPDGTGDYPNIQAAINAAASGDTVELGAGIFTGAGNRALDYMGKKLLLRSTAADPAQCAVDAEGTASVFYFRSGEGPEAIVDGITIANGSGTLGGGVHLEGASPIFRNCAFKGNTATLFGGAVYATGGTPEFTNCLFSENSADLNGGALQMIDGETLLSGCTFMNNTAGQSGGGVFFQNSHGSAQDCVFEANTASAGGGLCAMNGSLSVRACTFLLNTSQDGGGLWSNASTSLTIDGCAFRANGAVRGGGLRVVWGPVEVTSCTFSKNHASGDGAGVSAGNAVLTLTGSTFWANGAPSGGGISLEECIGSTIRNSIVSFSTEGRGIDTVRPGDVMAFCSDIFGNAGGNALPFGTGNFIADPLFCDPSTGDLRLRSDSPCAPGQQPSCGLVGAWEVGCPAPTPVEAVTWGRLKERFGR